MGLPRVYAEQMLFRKLEYMPRLFRLLDHFLCLVTDTALESYD